jgi:hypothetical protein
MTIAKPGAVLVALTSLTAAHAQIEPSAAELRRLEDDLSRALVERDTAVLDRLWHEDLFFIGTNGRQFTKAERMAGVRAGAPRGAGETNTNDDVEVRFEDGVAIAVVTSTWTVPSAAVPVGRYRALHVWTRVTGAWRLVAATVAVLRN